VYRSRRVLQELHKLLLDERRLQDNHRVALYGMGGIGKAQTTLAYVYANRKNGRYYRIYWMTAVDQASLFSGYQLIAKMEQVYIPPNSSPAETAALVIRWLQKVVACHR